ncbi:MAG TPA: LptF/LptG family permease [bacterium]|nr:LptF/LptG family permease [bacterium]
MSILDRYMVKEFLVYFLAISIGFVVLMTGNTAFVMSEFVMGKRIPIWVFSQILLLRSPAMFVLGFPVAVIFTVFLAMGRLAKDSELIAMRTGGISFQRVVLPFLGMAAVVSLLSFWLNEAVVPKTNHISQNYIRQFWLTDVMERAQAEVFFKIPGNMVIYTTGFDHQKQKMGELYLFQIDPFKAPTVTIAEAGKMDERFLTLTNGSSFEFKDSGDLDRISNFREYRTDISREVQELFGEQKTPQEMTSYELKDYLESFEESSINVNNQKTDYYFKFSIPVANFVFAMVGLLFVGSSPRKESYYGILVGLVLILVYWVVMTLFRAKGQTVDNPWDPRLAAWGPNALFFIIGLPLLLRSRR